MRSGNPMVKVDAEKAAKIGHLLFRYMRARHRFNEKTDRPLPAHELAALIGLGKTEFDDIYIEPDANPPIVFDGRADDVFEAIIKKKYRALPSWEPELLTAWHRAASGDAAQLLLIKLVSDIVARRSCFAAGMPFIVRALHVTGSVPAMYPAHDVPPGNRLSGVLAR